MKATCLVWSLVAAASALAAGPVIGGCPVFPPDHIWNTPIDKLPIHPRNIDYLLSIGPSKPLHPDFSSGQSGMAGGIPFVVVPANQPPVNVELASAESDPGPYPIPPEAPIEGNGVAGDRHVLVVQSGSCKLYELFSARPLVDGSWQASSGAIFDLRSYLLRPAGWTSADAAGLPILPGLIRYDEVAAGVISHALRFTAPRTQRAFVWPARHFASRHKDERLPPMGVRFRLRSTYRLEGFPPDAQVILKALKTYGMILADNGSPWFTTGAPDPRWNDRQLRSLRKVVGADFEAVDVSGLISSPDSAQVRKGGAPQ